MRRQRGGALFATTGALAPQRSADRPAKRREFKNNVTIFPTPTRLRRTPSCSRGRIIHTTTHQHPQLSLLGKRDERSGGSSRTTLLYISNSYPATPYSLLLKRENYSHNHSSYSTVLKTVPLGEEGQRGGALLATTMRNKHCLRRQEL